MPPSYIIHMKYIFFTNILFIGFLLTMKGLSVIWQVSDGGKNGWEKKRVLLLSPVLLIQIKEQHLKEPLVNNNFINHDVLSSCFLKSFVTVSKGRNMVIIGDCQRNGTWTARACLIPDGRYLMSNWQLLTNVAPLNITFTIEGPELLTLKDRQYYVISII